MYSFVFYAKLHSSDMFCSICNLYNWRYKRLGNLPHIQLYPEFRVANPGFFYDFQLINVGDFNGVGESAPNPFFYQVQCGKRLCLCCFTYEGQSITVENKV